MDFRYKRKYAAESGADGQGGRKKGRDGKSLTLRVPRGTLVRDEATGEIIQDMSSIQRAISQARENVTKLNTDENDEVSSLPLDALTMFENIAYLMARHADPEAVPDSVDAWLDGFETFSIYQVMPVIQELWEENLRTPNEPKKK